MKFIVCLLFSFLWLSCSTKPLSNIPNFAVVEPGIFRGGQPTDAGWANLRLAGITNVIKLNLSEEGSDDMAITNGMVVNNFPIDLDDQILGPIKIATVNGALSLIHKGTFVHCEHGQDRTGLIIAVYRVKSGWSKPKAEAEMLKLGFHKELHGLWDFWQDEVK